MNPRLQQLLAEGESRSVEFKTARRQLNRNLYETICAFLNRDGGDILLGVNDRGDVQGVDPDCVSRMKRDFATAINNPQKINPPCFLGMEEIEHEGVTLLHITVPHSSQVHRCNGRIYDRKEDGDFDITNNQTAVTQLYLRKQNYYSENTVYPYFTLKDLRPELITKARHVAGIHQKNHPWGSMDDSELLKSAKLFRRDPSGTEEGLTLAAILLFGKDDAILSALPHHKTDAILRRVDVDRYDDRDDIRTNLLDSYDRLIAFGEKHLNDPFYLEGIHRMSLRSHILREIVGNLLIHQEYSNPFPAKFVIERGRLFTENANRAHGHGPIDPRHFTPFAKNPVIARIFKEIGLADELGSGVRKLFKYCKTYCGHDPEMIEDDIFTLVLQLTDTAQATDQVTGQAGQLLDFCRKPRSREEMMQFLDLKHRVHFRREILQPLLESRLIVMTLPDKPTSPRQRYMATIALEDAEIGVGGAEIDQSIEHATDQATAQATAQAGQLLDFCRNPRSREEMMQFLDLKHRVYFRCRILRPLLDKGLLTMTLPKKPTSPKQRYLTTQQGQNGDRP